MMEKPFEQSQLEQLIMQWVEIRQPASNTPDTISNKAIENPVLSPAPIPPPDSELIEMTQADNKTTLSINDSVIDRQSLETLLKKPKLFIRLRDIYLKSTPQQLDLLEQAIEQVDFKQIEAIAHPCKSTSKQMGALQLAELLWQFEQQGRNAELSQDAEQLLQQVKQQYDSFSAALKDIEV